MAASQLAWRTRPIASRREDSERVSTVQTSEASAPLSTRNFQRGWVSQTISAAGKVARRAATAGKVWTMSPREPSRKTRKRGSGMRGLADGFEEVAGGVIFRIADNGDADAEAGGGGACGNGVGGVVGAFGVHIGTQRLEKGLDVGFAEEDHVVNATERGHE